MNNFIKHIYSVFFSLILVFSMNLRADAMRFINEISITNKSNDYVSDKDNKNFFNTNNSEEENKTSNGFEILEKINLQQKFSFEYNIASTKTVDEFYYLDLFSLLKSSLNTPPPEFI